MRKSLLVIFSLIILNSLIAQNVAHDKDWYFNGLELINNKNSEKATDYFFLKTKTVKNNEWVLLGQGMCYLYGVGVEKDVDKAIRLLGKSAKNENNEALYQMGIIYLENEETFFEANENTALTYLKKAVDNGSTKASIKLYEYYNEKGDNNLKLKYIRAAAQAKDPYAQYLYAVELEGQNNDSVAYRFYLEAASLGEPNATNFIGQRFEKENKKTEAYEYYKRSAQGGCWAGMTNLGRCYHYGIGVEKNLDTAEKWYYKAAKDGDNEVAQYYYGLWFQDKAETTKFTDRYNNYSNAFYWFEQASNKDYADAQYCLGYCYECGNGTSPSLTHAQRYYIMASKSNAKAKVRLGRCYELGSLDINKDYKKALEKYIEGYRFAKQINDVEAVAMAAYYIGLYYEKGIAVKLDKNKAIKLYDESVAGNNGGAAYRLYRIYEKTNYDKAMKYLSKAVELNNPDALYVDGMNLKKAKRTQDAMNRFAIAADENHSGACYQMGLIYKEKQQYTDALRYFCRALENGHKNAAFQIAQLYHFNYVKASGKKDNRDIAIRWYYIAAYMDKDDGKKLSPKNYYEELANKNYVDDYMTFKEYYLNCLLAEWRIKGPFESTETYRARTEKRDVKISKLSEQTINCYVKKNKDAIKNSFKISGYDADHKSYKFTSKYGKFVINVEPEHAKDFSEGFMIDVDDSYWSNKANNPYKTLQKLAVVCKNKLYYSDKNNLHDTTVICIDYTTDEIDTPKYIDVHDGIPVSDIIDPYLFVLIIGNGKYDFIDKINYVDNDVKWVEQYCRKALGVSAENIVIGKDLNYSGMKRTVNTFCDKLKHQRENMSRVIVYYSGHGTSKDGVSYLIPTDGEPDKQPLCNLYDLSDQIMDAGAQDMTFFVDACFDGTSKNGGNITKTKGVAKLEPVAKPLAGNSVAFYATQTSAVVYKDKGHGLFTYYLLKAIKENKVSYKELGDYLEEKVSETSVKINSNIEQVPIIVPGMDMIEDKWMDWKLIR